MNVFTFSGNLGRDAEVKNLGSTTVCNFSVAVKSGYGEKEKTEWINCALWGKRAEGGLPQYLLKGQSVVVSGELSTREYQANDGTTRTSVEVRVNDLTLAGKRDELGIQPQPQAQTQQHQPQPQQRATPPPGYIAPQQQPQQQPQNNFDNDKDIPF